MTNEQMITDLENMAGQALRMWGIEEDSAKESVHTQAYALCCTAIAALSAPKPFIQIGRDILRRDDIIRVEIREADDYYKNPKKIRLYTRDLVGSEVYSSLSTCHSYNFHSPEGQTLLEWLQGQSEILMPYEDPLHIQADYEDSVNREFQRDELAHVTGIVDSVEQDIEPEHPF